MKPENINRLISAVCALPDVKQMSDFELEILNICWLEGFVRVIDGVVTRTADFK